MTACQPPGDTAMPRKTGKTMAPAPSPSVMPAPGDAVSPDFNTKEYERITMAPAPSPSVMPAPGDAVPPDFNTEEYERIRENSFKNTLQDPISTFSIDVDTASYANLRRFIQQSRVPPRDAVRIEEMINYFSYDYPEPAGEHPFSITTEAGPCPWNQDHRLVHIGLQGKNLDYANLKPANLVFLIDSSGSMSAPNKLPLLKKSFKLLLNECGENDRISIVAYAGAAGLILPPTPAGEKEKILASLDRLQAGGSTAGGAGIRLAYDTAEKSFIPDGNNRVILATDGDFNIGVSSTSELVRLIENKRKTGIFLTILGFGMGNYKDGRMERISNAGNGNYFYIDTIREAEKVFVREMRANLFTIAQDVKIQVEFNPATVAGWRLIGYENRLLATEDFNDDTKDAGELGAGHTVTALYELVPAGTPNDLPPAAKLRYQKNGITPAAGESPVSGELLHIRFRYKPVGENISRLMEQPLSSAASSLDATSENFRFSAAVAGFGMLLRDSKFKNELNYDDVLALARSATGRDENGDRAEMIRLIEIRALMEKAD
ncbi:MAG: hypothetical protein CSB33_03830 [Desulfobacterales bacterium]|nr:MAG: hypothetical protein CSB33_03830 [Desulfobacterales bacterium]